MFRARRFSAWLPSAPGVVVGVPIRYGSPQMRRPSTSRLTLALAAAVVLLALAPGVGVGLLYLAPALVLALPLLHRRYVGERQIARFARHMARRLRRAAVRLLASARAPRVLVPRSGRLLACSLASRPPPAVAPAT